MVLKQLFGGAIVCELPGYAIDVSDVRQVPDNQEVFMFRGSNLSIIIEVLERVSEEDDVNAVKFHFEALAHDNNATSFTMRPPSVVHRGLQDQPSPVILHGSQVIHKFNAIVPDYVDISVALFRIEFDGKSADVVVSENIPGDSSDDAKKGAANMFDSLVSSFRVVDYGLFR